MTDPGRPYHHGDLRRALVSKGRELIEKDTADRLSLRDLAQRIGVSPASVYRHFADKDALLAAIALDGRGALDAAYRKAFTGADKSSAGLEQAARAHVRFAQDHPGLFRLIFRPGSGGCRGTAPGDGMQGPVALDHALAATAEGIEARIAALRFWALAHGLAMLIADRQLSPGDPNIDRVFASSAIAMRVIRSTSPKPSPSPSP